MATFHVGIRKTREDEIEILWTIDRASHEDAVDLARRLVADSAPYWRAYINGRRMPRK